MTLAKLTIKVLHKDDVLITAYFNPEEYTINQDNNFAVQPVPGLSAPLVQFVNGNLRTLEMELLFDTWDAPDASKKDVRTLTGPVIHLMDIDSELHAPPLLMVSWATLQFRCVLARATQKFILFAEAGFPVRARLNVTFNYVADLELEAQRKNLQTADYTKLHVVVEGETLSSIAAHFYDDPALWRPIALANALANPRRLGAGQTLRIPSLPFIDPLTREVIQ